VEILVATLIFGLVLAAAVKVLLALIRTEAANQQELNRKNQVGRVLGLIQNEISNASRIQSGGSVLTGCSATVTPLLTLYGASAAETITYGLRAISSNDTNWQGPNVLVRCGPQYRFLRATGSTVDTSTPILDTSTLIEQELVDNVPDGGFTRNLLGGTGFISRSVQLGLSSNISGGKFLGGGTTTITNTLQVPISSNQIYNLAASGDTTCATGCDSPDGSSTHWKPSFPATIEGDYEKEDVVYFDGNQTLYNISGYSTDSTKNNRCLSGDADSTTATANCTVALKTSPTVFVTIYNADVLSFSDGDIRVPPEN
jgi:hypothetical protein